MKTPEDIQNKILLRSTGELAPEEERLLSEHLATDAEAAAFSHFLNDQLPAATTAPRDFAAIAIKQAAARDRTFQRILPWAVAAAVVVLGTVVWLPDGKKATQNVVTAETVITKPSPRVTSSLSTRISLLEGDLAATRTRLSKSRYNRTTTL